MAPALRNELKQRKPFGSLHQEAQLNLERTHAVLADAFDRMLKPYGISSTQYNVLRILRGAESTGLCRNEIRDRLVTRARDEDDRRLVKTRLTATGRELVDRLDAPVEEEHRRALGHLSESQLRTLIELLTLTRAIA